VISKAHVNIISVMATALILSACASTPPRVSQNKPAKEFRPQPVVNPTLTLPPAKPGSDLDRVVGSDASGLTRLFGKADADVREGTARKLQFGMGKACILDAYLYPTEKSRTPVVTYVAARLPDGRDIDRNQCISTLKKR
jgi:hypothetical protein